MNAAEIVRAESAAEIVRAESAVVNAVRDLKTAVSNEAERRGMDLAGTQAGELEGLVVELRHENALLKDAQAALRRRVAEAEKRGQDAVAPQLSDLEADRRQLGLTVDELQRALKQVGGDRDVACNEVVALKRQVICLSDELNRMTGDRDAWRAEATKFLAASQPDLIAQHRQLQELYAKQSLELGEERVERERLAGQLAGMTTRADEEEARASKLKWALDQATAAVSSLTARRRELEAEVEGLRGGLKSVRAMSDLHVEGAEAARRQAEALRGEIATAHVALRALEAVWRKVAPSSDRCVTELEAVRRYFLRTAEGKAEGLARTWRDAAGSPGLNYSLRGVLQELADAVENEFYARPGGARR